MLVLYGPTKGDTVKFYVTEHDPGFMALKELIAERLKVSPGKSSITLATSLQISLCEKEIASTNSHEHKVAETIILPEGLDISVFVKSSNTYGTSSSGRDSNRVAIRQLGITREQDDGQDKTEYFSLFIDFSAREVNKLPIPARTYARAS
ncbi:hypothetical protein D3C87_1374560 [compost metagenome]